MCAPGGADGSREGHPNHVQVWPKGTVPRLALVVAVVGWPVGARVAAAKRGRGRAKLSQVCLLPARLQANPPMGCAANMCSISLHGAPPSSQCASPQTPNTPADVPIRGERAGIGARCLGAAVVKRVRRVAHMDIGEELQR